MGGDPDEEEGLSLNFCGPYIAIFKRVMVKKRLTIFNSISLVTIFCLSLSTFQAVGAACDQLLISNGFSQGHRQQVRQIVSEVEPYLKYLRAPSVGVELANGPLESRFLLENIIEVAFASPLTMNPTSYRTIFVHEYGHAVFHENVSLNIDGQSLSMRRLEYMALRSSSIERLLVNRVDAYNELFADLLAVVDADDGAAVNKLISEFSRRPLVDISINPYFRRDFTQSFILSSESKPREGFRKYNLFDSSRSELWQDYINGASLEGRALALKAFLKSASEHLEIQYRRGDYLVPLNELRVAQVRELNREFLRLFRKTYNELTLEKI